MSKIGGCSAAGLGIYTLVQAYNSYKDGGTRGKIGAVAFGALSVTSFAVSYFAFMDDIDTLFEFVGFPKMLKNVTHIQSK